MRRETKKNIVKTNINDTTIHICIFKNTLCTEIVDWILIEMYIVCLLDKLTYKYKTYCKNLMSVFVVFSRRLRCAGGLSSARRGGGTLL